MSFWGHKTQLLSRQNSLAEPFPFYSNFFIGNKLSYCLRENGEEKNKSSNWDKKEFMTTQEIKEKPTPGKKSVLIVVEADPERSPRFAEALRVAAGLSMHPYLRVSLVLKEPLLRFLDEKAFSRWVDSDVIDGAWSDLKENGCRIFSAKPQDEHFDCLIQFDSA